MPKVSKKHVVNRLIELALLYPDLSCYRGPGKLMKKLTPEEREVAKTLTADDFQHRIK